MEKADKIILEYFLWSFTAVYGLEAVFEARNGSVAYHRLATVQLWNYKNSRFCVFCILLQNTEDAKPWATRYIIKG